MNAATDRRAQKVNENGKGIPSRGHPYCFFLLYAIPVTL